MEKELIKKLIKILDENHGVFVVKQTNHILTVKSSVGILHKMSFNMAGKIFPELLNPITSEEHKIEILKDHTLNDLIFVEEVCFQKQTGVKNFEVIRFPVHSLTDLDNISKALNE